jgi:hypothetical protein
LRDRIRDDAIDSEIPRRNGQCPLDRRNP